MRRSTLPRQTERDEHGNRALTPEQVKTLRELYVSGACTLKDLAERAGLSTSAVFKIARNWAYYDHHYTPPSQRERQLLRRFHISRSRLPEEAA